MMKIQTSARNTGVNLKDDGSAQINIWAPLAKEVKVIKDGGTTLPLKKQNYGYWTAVTQQLQDGDKYKIAIDDKEPLPDITSLLQPDGVHGSSAVVSLSYDWTDGGWKNLSLEQYIIYELHTGTFTTAGTFASIEEKLDDLLAVGINAIEIMPIAQFPGERNWGYDGVFPYAVQHSYGGVKGLQHLVDTCHAKGMAVVLDVVYNHLGPEGNYLGAYAPYFTEKYHTPWGAAINYDDAWCDGVRQYFIENTLMWLRDFHIDALRFDAVHAIKDFSPTHILKEIRQRVNELMEQTGREHHLIIECDLNDTRFIDPLEKGGYAANAQWTDEFHHALRVAAGEPKDGYYADFNGIADLAKVYKDAYVYDGQYSDFRHKHFGIKATENTGNQFVVFSQNHDQVGNRMLGERSSALYSFEMQKLLAAAVMVSPYLPLLFMGEEWAETNPFLYFVSHTDKELAEAVRKGRKEEFKAFHADGEAPDPMAPETYNRSKLQWAMRRQEPHATMLRYYTRLIAIRKQYAALYDLNRKNLEISCSETDKTITLRRWSDDEDVLCLMNFSKEVRKMQIPNAGKKWEKLVASADTEWKGSAANAENNQTEDTINVQPESIIIYCNHE